MRLRLEPVRPGLTFDQANVAGARSLLRILRSELHTLAFAKQLEHRAANGAAMKKMFDSAFIADKSESLVDEEPRDRPGWHTRVLRCSSPETTQSQMP